MGLLGVFVSTFIVTAVGGGLGYFIWLKLQKPKIVWDAEVYTTGDSFYEINGMKFKDLIAYNTDVIERIIKGPGIVYHRLMKLDKTCPDPDSVPTAVHRFGNKRRVSCLLQDGSVTLMEKRFNDTEHNSVFDPVPYDKLILASDNIHNRINRLQSKKSALEAITPFIVAGIAMITIVAVVFITYEKTAEITEMHMTTERYITDKLVGLGERNDINIVGGLTDNSQKQETG